MNHPLKHAPIALTPASHASAAATLALNYVDALTAADAVRLDALQAADFVLDVMCNGATSAGPLLGPQSHQFWPAWHDGFSCAQFHVQSLRAALDLPLPAANSGGMDRSSTDRDGMDRSGMAGGASTSSVLVQWIFTGVHTGELRLPIWRAALPPTWQRLQMSGLSTYRVENDSIMRETTYIDLNSTQLLEAHPTRPLFMDAAKGGHARTHVNAHSRHTGKWGSSSVGRLCGLFVSLLPSSHQASAGLTCW